MRHEIGRLTAAAALLGLLAGCTSGSARPVSSAVPKTLSPTPGSPAATPAAATAAANAQVTRALGALSTARLALDRDFSWVPGALGTQQFTTDPNKLLLWGEVRRALGSARNDARTAAKDGRAAAQAVPRNCAGALTGRARVYADIRHAQTAYAELQRLAANANGQLARATTDRTRVTTALANLDRVVRANPAATADTALERMLSRGHSLQEQQVLVAAVAKAQQSGAQEIGLVSKIAAAAGTIGSAC